MLLMKRSNPKLLDLLGGLAQFALVLAILFERLGDPRLAFWTGLLLGFSATGNLVTLWRIGRARRSG